MAFSVALALSRPLSLLCARVRACVCETANARVGQVVVFVYGVAALVPLCADGAPLDAATHETRSSVARQRCNVWPLSLCCDARWRCGSVKAIPADERHRSALRSPKGTRARMGGEKGGGGRTMREWLGDMSFRLQAPSSERGLSWPESSAGQRLETQGSPPDTMGGPSAGFDGEKPIGWPLAGTARIAARARHHALAWFRCLAAVRFWAPEYERKKRLQAAAQTNRA